MNKRKSENMDEGSQITKQAKIINVIISEDDTIKFDFMTSLQNIVMAKIVTNLWMNQNTQQEIKNFLCNQIIGPVRRDPGCIPYLVQCNIVSKVSELTLPKSIIEKLINIVPIIGKSILHWIKCYNIHILNKSEDSKYSSGELISNITWTARGKIDCTQTAKNILANQNICLSDDHKYKLATFYCLEDEIAVLAPNVVNDDYLKNISIYHHPMVHFWTLYITGDNKILYKTFRQRIGDNISINAYIMGFLLRRSDASTDIPLRYVWGKLSEEERAENIVKLVKKLDNQDFRYFLLSSLDYQQQQDVFKECSYVILNDISNDWIWRDYFLTITLHFLNIMDPLHFVSILQDVTDKMIENRGKRNTCAFNLYKSIFKKLWQKASRPLKELFLKYNSGFPLRYFATSSLFWELGMDIIELIFNDLTTEQKKNMILEHNGMEFCANCIKSDRWDLLELLIKYTLCSEEDMILLKEIVIEECGHGTAEHFSKQRTLHKMEYFMRWALKSEEKIDEFRQKLAHVACEDTLRSIMANNNIVDLMKLDNLFKWCAKGDIELVNKFKSEIPKLYSEKIFTTLLKDEKYELLEQFLTWHFLGDPTKIEQFKSNVYKNNHFGVISLTLILIKRDNSFKMLDKFVDWCFTKEQQVQEFKMWVLQSTNVCIELLWKHQLELADKLIKWSGISSEAISTFKNEYILSDHMKQNLYFMQEERKCCCYVTSLIKWLNPSKETVQKLKKLISNDFYASWVEKNTLRNFYKLLSKFIPSQDI